MRLEE